MARGKPAASAKLRERRLRGFIGPPDKNGDVFGSIFQQTWKRVAVCLFSQNKKTKMVLLLVSLAAMGSSLRSVAPAGSSPSWSSQSLAAQCSLPGGREPGKPRTLQRRSPNKRKRRAGFGGTPLLK